MGMVSEGDLRVVAVAFVSYLLLPCSTNEDQEDSLGHLVDNRAITESFFSKENSLAQPSVPYICGSPHPRSPKAMSAQTVDGEL